MVDPIDLVFLENAQQPVVELARGGEVGAERLFDDDAPPGAVLFAGEAGLPKTAADRHEGRRRRRQIEQPVALGVAFALDARQLRADLLVGRFVVGLALDIGNAAKQLFDDALVDVARGEFRQAFGEIIAEGFAGRRAAGNADQRKGFRQQP